MIRSIRKRISARSRPRAILQGVDEQVQKSIAAGAKLLTGGNRIKRDGFFYEPTVLADIPRDSPAYSEEVFGPVALFFRVATRRSRGHRERQRNLDLAQARGLTTPPNRNSSSPNSKSGMVFINGMVASDPRLPFGGVKRSGFGRELGCEGIREFVNTKTVVVA